MGTLAKPHVSDTPAPGQYETASNLLKPRAPSFGAMRGERQLINSDGKGKDTPGVGQYNNREIIGKDGRKSTISGRNDYHTISNTSLGPGAYLGHGSLSPGGNRQGFGNRSEKKLP